MVWVSSQSRLSFGREDSLGSKPSAFGGSNGSSSPRLLGITNSNVSLPDKTTDVRDYNTFGHGRRRFLHKEGRFEYGPATIDFIPTTAELFYYAFTTEVFQEDLAEDGTQDTGTSGLGTHTLIPDGKGTIPSDNDSTSETTTDNSTVPPSMTLSCIVEGGTNDFRRDFEGTVVDSLNVSLNESGELTASMDFRAQDVTDHDSSSPTLWSQPSDDGTGDVQPYMFYDRNADITMMGTYDYTTNSMSSGRTWANVKSFNWSISNNLKPLYFTQSSEAQDVFTFVTSQPDFSLSMEIVPDSNLQGTDSNSVYDLLENGTKGDILIPFKRGTDDILDFVFEDAIIRSAPHPLNESGDEVTVSVEVMPEEIRVVSVDTVGQYSSA